MGKKIGLTTTIATSTSGTIAQVRGISGPGASGDSVDCTTLDNSGRYRAFLGGLVDGGEVTLDLVYDTEDADHKLLAQLLTSQDEKVWTITYPSTFSAQVFSGFVSGLSAETPLDDLITAQCTIKVTGTPGFSS
jgi:predicted secreted protein